MEVSRITNKEQILKNLQELDIQLENRQISRKEYNVLKKQYQEKLESIQVIERIRRMQGNTTPYSERIQEKEVSTEATKQHDKEIIQKYITQSKPKTEILEQSLKDQEDDKSLLKKYLKPEDEEISEEKINRPKLNDPEDDALIKKFITDPTSKREVNKKTTKEEPITTKKLKYAKPKKKTATTDKPESDKTKRSPEDRKEAILSIISNFGKKTKSQEPPIENEPIENSENTLKSEPKLEIKEEGSEAESLKDTNVEDIVEEKSSKEAKTVEDEVSEVVEGKSVKEVETVEDEVSEAESLKDTNVEVKSAEEVETVEDEVSEVAEETKSDVGENAESNSHTSSEPKGKKERPKLKESIIVNSEDILKPKKNKESIPIKEVSSLLDSDTPKPKPKESINVSSKDVSDAISYAMGESTSIVNLEDITKTKDADKKSIDEPKISKNPIEESDKKGDEIKSFFGFKVGSNSDKIEEVSESKSPTNQETGSSEKDTKSHKPVFSDSVKDSVLNAKPEVDKKPVFSDSVKDSVFNAKSETDKAEVSKEKDEKTNDINPPLKTEKESLTNSESKDSEEETPVKSIDSSRPIFAVKSNDELLSSENLQTENKSILSITKSISDFRNSKKESKSKDNLNKSEGSSDEDVDSQTIYPVNPKQEKSESEPSEDSIMTKPSIPDDEKRQKFIIGGILLVIILIIIAVIGFNAYAPPKDNTTLYIDDTALALNDTLNESSQSLNTASASTDTVTSSNVDKNNVYTDNQIRNNYSYHHYRNSSYNNNSNKNDSDDPNSDDPSSDGPFNNVST